MKTVNYNRKLENIKQLEAKVKYYKEMKDYYETLFMNCDLNNPDIARIERDMKYYQVRFKDSLMILRELKIELRDICNVDAFGYDCPCRLDDSYYEKKFKHDGYLVGIRL